MQKNIDVLIPKENVESILASINYKNTDEIILSYPQELISDYIINKIKHIAKKINIKLKAAIIISNNISTSKLRKISSKFKDCSILINYETNSEQIRQIAERFHNIYIYNLEFDKRIDYIHQRNSGINHILANIIKNNSIKLLFNFKYYLSKTPNEQKIILGRLKQNLELCKKFNIEYDIVSFASKESEVKSSLESIKITLEKNKK